MHIQYVQATDILRCIVFGLELVLLKQLGALRFEQSVPHGGFPVQC